MSNLKKKFRQCIIRNLMKVLNLLYGIDENKVIFKSFENQYSCNPKAISEKLHELSPNTQIVWIFTNPEKVSENVPEYIKKVKDSTLEKLKELSTSKVWVDNCVKVASTWKSSKQYYIQTWHGDKAFKKIGFDAGKEPENFKKIPVFDLAIAGSKYGEIKYRNAFHYYGEVLNIGTPRNDILINPNIEQINKTRNILNIENDVKLLLYAPTFRDSNSSEKQTFHGLDIEETLINLEKKTGNKWVCLLRAHHLVHKGFINQGIQIDKCIDVSAFDDIADLMQCADIMISDYSSCAGDFALTKKPLILYQGDIKEYSENSRSFYFNVSESPYFIAKNQEELNNIINEMTEEKARLNCEQILEFYGSTETGNASETIAKIIISKLKEKK